GAGPVLRLGARPRHDARAPGAAALRAAAAPGRLRPRRLLGGAAGDAARLPHGAGRRRPQRAPARPAGRPRGRLRGPRDGRRAHRRRGPR
ncbi:MAG: pseudouridine synthase, partial [Planctomycetes bacterium]|nr:pseudouridine synthase [Planctomycetota bacterium]